MSRWTFQQSLGCSQRLDVCTSFQAISVDITSSRRPVEGPWGCSLLLFPFASWLKIRILVVVTSCKNRTSKPIASQTLCVKQGKAVRTLLLTSMARCCGKALSMWSLPSARSWITYLQPGCKGAMLAFSHMRCSVKLKKIIYTVKASAFRTFYVLLTICPLTVS